MSCGTALEAGMIYRYFAVAASIIMGSSMQAQRVLGINPEVRPFLGVYLPEGEIKAESRSGVMLGLQGALELSSHFHVLGSFSWTFGHSRVQELDHSQSFLWQYDAGFEMNLLKRRGGHWLFRPFAGLGAGARIYDYRASNAGRSDCTASYATIGTELQRASVAWRLEGRGYLACYVSPITGQKHTGNDFAILFGTAMHVQ
jgi:hypothetical protein